MSEENSFIFHESFNKGHVRTPTMVNNCIGLSNNAKAVYASILNHVFERGHAAFPSIYRLAIACSCSVNSVTSYVNELTEKGLIDKIPQGRGRSNVYFIRDCIDVPLLKISEILWKVMSDLTKLYSWKNILSSKEDIIKYMNKNKYKLHHVVIDDKTATEFNELFLHVLKGGKLDVGLLPRNAKFQQKQEVTKEVTVPNKVKSTDKSSNTSRSVKYGMDTNHWKMKDVSEWKVPQFKDYYYDLYFDVVGQPHPKNKAKHTGLVRRVLKNLNNDNALLKQYIDKSFEIEYENRTLDYFSSSNRLGEIQTYISTGQKPFYIRRKPSKQEDIIPEEKKTKMASKDLFDKVLGGDDK